MDEIEQIKQRLDISEVISSYLTLKKAGANLKANCPFHNEKTPSFMVSPERQTFKCFGCFPAGQLVETVDGFKEIQTIKKDELVYTDKGRLRKVNLVFKRKYRGDLIEIIPRMTGMLVKLTGDHKIFAIRTTNCTQKSRKTRICQKNCRQNCSNKFFRNYRLEKIEARELKVNDFLLYPIKENKASQKTIDLVKYAKVAFKRGKKPRNFQSDIQINQSFARLSGLYIAEGSSHRAYVRFSFGNSEDRFAKEVVCLIEKIFELNASIHYRKGRNGIEVTCCNSLLARTFEKIFGKGAENKHIPQFFFGQNNEIKSALINAIHDGDGTLCNEGKKNKSGRKAITTISPLLINQLKDILLSIGQRPCIYQHKAYRSAVGTNHKKSYCINWRENDKTHFSDFNILNGVNYWLLPIKKIDIKNFEGNVYNLNVDEDHSYLTQGFAVSNCGEGGDIFTFVEKMEGLDFYNTLKLLADKAGVKLENRSFKRGDQEFKSDAKTRVYEINDWAKKLYHKVLVDHPKAEHARKYLRDRGLSEKTILEFELGYAPDSWDFLIKFLEKKKYTHDEIIKAGVAIRSERGGAYDRFRGRIIFPINNIMGATVAFTSRILKDDGKSAKYINSSESPIYIKGKTIYGLDKAKLAIKENDLAVFVEGNMDVIACHQAGFKNVVATSGTAITEDQLKILSRYAETVAFSFDSDEAGIAAMKKAIKLSLKNDIATKIIALRKPYKDPDEAIKADPKNWQKAVEEAKPSLEYWIDLLVSKNPDLGILTKKKIAKEILPVIKTIYSDIEKEYYIKYLSSKLIISEKALIAALEKTANDKEIVGNVADKKIQKTNLTLAQKLLGFLWITPGLISVLSNDIKSFLSIPEVKQFSEMVQSGHIAKEEISDMEANILNQYEIVLRNDYNFEDSESINREFLFLSGRMKTESSEKIKSEFAIKIAEAEKTGDKRKLTELLTEFSSLIK